MRLETKDILNKHRGQSAFIIGHGPSLNPHIDRIKDYRDKGFILFGCNEWYYIYDTAPNYLVYASSVDTMMKNKDMLNSHAGKTVAIYADSADVTNREWVASNVVCDYMPYDQRHFGGAQCGSIVCCPHIIPGRLTVQEELQRYSGADKHYGGGDTVALHMLSFAILMGCDPIYFVGIEIDYSIGYAKNKGSLASKVPPNDYDNWRDRIYSDFTIIRDAANRVGTKMINLNKNSRFNHFEIGDICV